MNTLAAFQEDFAGALYTDSPDVELTRQPAFAIYRNTAMRASLDALEANYPGVVCLVGRDWFRAAAAIHVVESPPRDTRLILYGDEFADFLAGFAPAGDLPYLADVARLDRLWTESLVAADATTLVPAAIAALDADSLGALRLRPHPALRVFGASLPAVSIWQASRAGMPASADMVWQAESAIVARIDHEVRVTPVDAPTRSLLEAIVAGAPLADAALSTLDRHPGARIDLLLASLLQAGAFAD